MLAASGSASRVSVKIELSRPPASVIQPGTPSLSPTLGALRHTMLDSDIIEAPRAVFASQPLLARLAANDAASVGSSAPRAPFLEAKVEPSTSTEIKFSISGWFSPVRTRACSPLPHVEMSIEKALVSSFFSYFGFSSSASLIETFRFKSSSCLSSCVCSW